MIQLRVGRVSLFLMIAGFVACGGDGGDGGATADTVAAQNASSPPATPMQLTAGQFGQLRWIEGTWRGSGVEQPTFYERYAFVDDSTIRAESSSDSTFPNADEASHIVLREGKAVTGDGTYEWSVTSIDARSVHFEPTLVATNAFTWTSDADSAWTARLTWNAPDGTPNERIYQMRRMP